MNFCNFIEETQKLSFIKNIMIKVQGLVVTVTTYMIRRYIPGFRLIDNAFELQFESYQRWSKGLMKG